MESGGLSDRLDAAWARRVELAEAWNTKLDAGDVHPNVLKRFVWNLKALRAGTDFSKSRSDLESEWRTTSGRKHASLAWSLNDVLGRMFWYGGLFKVLGDTSQLMGPLVIKVCNVFIPVAANTISNCASSQQAIINFSKQRASARENGEAPPNVGRGVAMAIGLWCIVVLTAMFQHQVSTILSEIFELCSKPIQFFWRSMTTGVLARAALINSIYKRGVALTAQSRSQFTTAALVTSISTDVGVLTLSVKRVYD